MSSRTRLTTLLLALTAAASFAGPAQAAPLHPTQIVETCGSPNYGDIFTVLVYDCGVTVTDTSASGATAPTGEVFSGSSRVCNLVPSQDIPVGSCISLEGGGPGPLTVTVEYRGDGEHAPSTFTHVIGGGPVTEPPAGPPASTGGPSYSPAPAGRAAQTRILHRPARRTRSHLARFVFSPGGAHEYRLDGGAWKRCGAQVSRRVATGRHTLSVRTVGVSGQMPSKPTVFAWQVLPRRP